MKALMTMAVLAAAALLTPVSYALEDGATCGAGCEGKAGNAGIENAALDGPLAQSNEFQRGELQRERGDRPGRGERIRERIQAKMKQRFAEKDTNGDGLLSQEEAPGLFERHPDLDTDGDGGVSPAELRTALEKNRGDRGDRAARHQRRFERLDADASGTITTDEWKGPQRIFDHLDKNADGVLSQKEFMDRAERGGQGRGRGRDLLGQHDTDGDGAISREEFPGEDAKFDRLDRNADGVIGQDELPRRQRGMRGGPGRRAERMAELDVDGDGEISRDEFPGDDEKFDRMDRNGDGVLNQEDRPEGRGRGPGQRDKPERGDKPFF